MIRAAFALFLGLTASLLYGEQNSSDTYNNPSFLIALTPGIASESFQLHYFMSGPFGGRGAYLSPKPGLHSVPVPTSFEGKKATEIKVAMYAPGCAIQTFSVNLQSSSHVRKEFWCRHVQAVALEGRIMPLDLLQNGNPELLITYMAPWVNRFFGIVDGAVTQINIASTSLNADGRFRVDLPDLASDAASSLQQDANFYLSLRDAKTWNPIASDLQPELSEFTYGGRGLRVQGSYPLGLKFAPRSRYSLQYEQQPFYITIATPHDLVQTGEEIYLQVKLTNTSPAEITFVEPPGGPPSAEFQYQIEVRDTSGQPPPDTEYGRQHRRSAHFLRSQVSWTLQPGESMSDATVLTKLFDLSRPDTYEVRASRTVPPHTGNGTVTSNTIAVVVHSAPGDQR